MKVLSDSFLPLLFIIMCLRYWKNHSFNGSY